MLLEQPNQIVKILGSECHGSTSAYLISGLIPQLYR